MSKNNIIKRKLKKAKKIEKNKKIKEKNNKYEKVLNVMCDIGSILHYICGKYNIIDVDYDFKKLFLDLSNNIDEDDDKNILLKLIENLEILIKNTLESYSLYEMIYFSRRIRPMNVFKCKKNEIFLYRNVMQLAFQKYCKKESQYYITGENILPIQVKGLNMDTLLKNDKFEFYPTYIQNKLKIIGEMFNVCYLIEKYSFYHVYLVKQYRTLCKGAELIYSDKYGICCSVDKELAEKLELMDNRNKYFNIISSVGGYCNLDVNIDDIKQLDNFIIPNFQENLEEIKYNLLKDKKTIVFEDEIITNYWPGIMNLKNYYYYASNFNEKFLNYYGFTIQEFFIFMIIICKNNMIEMIEDISRRYQLFQRGYSMYKYEVLKSNFIDNYDYIAELYGFEKNKNLEELFEKIFKYLTISNLDKDNINLRAINGHKIFMNIDEHIGIVDYTNWVRVLEGLMIPICSRNDKKGIIFEDIVIEKVKKEYGESSLWVCKRELKANKIKREIDVSFIIDDLLVILECKAVNFSLASFVGDKEAVDFRKMKNDKAIRQADKTLKFIEENQKALNIKIPQNIRGVVSLIVTPAPEYIWELGDNFIINNTLPRIMCIEELVELKKESVIKDIYNKRFYRNLV